MQNLSQSTHFYPHNLVLSPFAHIFPQNLAQFMQFFGIIWFCHNLCTFSAKFFVIYALFSANFVTIYALFSAKFWCPKAHPHKVFDILLVWATLLKSIKICTTLAAMVGGFLALRLHQKTHKYAIFFFIKPKVIRTLWNTKKNIEKKSNFGVGDLASFVWDFKLIIFDN